MNYIKEINAFYMKIELNPLTASATALWHTLLHLNNRAGWIKEFSVAATVVCFKSGLPESTFKRARNELRDKGYITYTSRGRQAPIYKMISLVKESKQEEKVQQSASTKLRVSARKNGERLSEKTVTFYLEHFGHMKKHIRKEAVSWAQLLSDSHVLGALQRAVESGNISWQYVKGILHNWKNSQLYTMADVLKAEQAFRKQRTRYSHKQQRTEHKEVIPDWFYEHKKKSHSKLS